MIWGLFFMHITHENIAHGMEFPPCDPESPVVSSADPEYPHPPSPAFCAKWDPYFSFRSGSCCGKIKSFRNGNYKTKVAKNTVALPSRSMPFRSILGRNSCSEVTTEQQDYIASVKAGAKGDILEVIRTEQGMRGEQAFCNEHDGFLAFGRPVVSTENNRLLIHHPEKCLYFGTDHMVGMLEWAGREVAKKYSGPSLEGVKLVIGNISGPKGGPLYNAKGKRRHLSHANGQDADIGFLSTHHLYKNDESINQFSRNFDAKVNWWLLQKIFNNPFACVKAVFVDRHLIHKLAQVAKNDRAWSMLRRFIRHMPGHKNHFHIRIGKNFGESGCVRGDVLQGEYEVDEEEKEE